jgi:DNA-binding transcriptional MerR regulator
MAKGLTIHELAERTGLAVRHLRELQTRGTLEPPELLGRKGLYNERHVTRVALVRRLQERGYSLSAIADLLEGWRQGAGIDVVLGLEDAVTDAPAGGDLGLAEEPLLKEYPELAKDPALLASALAAGLLQREQGVLSAPNAELLELARTFLSAGLSAQAMIAEFARLRRDTRAIAARLRETFMREVVVPLQEQGMPAARLAELSQALLTMRPAAARAVFILMNRALYAEPPPEPAAPVKAAASKRKKARRPPKR